MYDNRRDYKQWHWSQGLHRSQLCLYIFYCRHYIFKAWQMYHCTLCAAEQKLLLSVCLLHFSWWWKHSWVSFFCFWRHLGFSTHKGKKTFYTRKAIKRSSRKQKNMSQDEKIRSCPLNVLALLSEDTKAKIILSINQGYQANYTTTLPINCPLPNFNADKCWLIDLYNFLAKWKSHVNMFFVCRKYGLGSFYYYCFPMPKEQLSK